MTPPRLDEGSEREAFEAAYMDRLGLRAEDYGLEYDSASNRYADDEEQGAWWAWQASAALSTGRLGGQWISVEERLPAHEQEVICTGFIGNDPAKERWQDYAVFHKEGSFYDREVGDELYPPTHWRELLDLPSAPASIQGEKT